MRLVFDTQYFKTLREPELRELRRRGYALSISMSAYTETIRQAKDQGKPGLLFGPAGRFAEFVDAQYPIAAQTGALSTRLGASPRAGQSAADYLEVTRADWQRAIARDPDLFERGGSAAQQYIAEERAGWMELASPWSDRLFKEMSDQDYQTLVAADVQDLRETFEQILCRAMTNRGMRKPGPRERFDAHVRVYSLYLVEAGRNWRQPTGNDAEDLLQLTHVGEPALFITQERKILGLVDRSGSHQAPWVRMLVEVFTERMPQELPWGAVAKRIGRTFQRRPYDELLAEEGLLLRRMRATKEASPGSTLEES